MEHNCVGGINYNCSCNDTLTLEKGTREIGIDVI